MADDRIERTVDMARRIGWMKGIAAALIMTVAWNALSLVTAAASDQTEAPYSQVIEEWRAEGQREIEDALYVIDSAAFSESGAVSAEDSVGYAGSAVRLDKGDCVQLSFGEEHRVKLMTRNKFVDAMKTYTSRPRRSSMRIFFT